MLAPVVRHVVPSDTLNLLQARFHELLRAELEGAPRSGIRLPPLAPLTELERPEMYFPVSMFHKVSKRRQAQLRHALTI